MERIGEDLGGPDQAGLHILDDEQMHRPKQQSADAEREPQIAEVAGRIRSTSLCGLTVCRSVGSTRSNSGESAQIVIRTILRRIL